MENSQEDFDTVFDDFINYPNDMQPEHGYIGEGTAGFALEQQGFNYQAQSFPSTFEPALDSSRFQNQQFSLPEYLQRIWDGYQLNYTFKHSITTRE